MLRHLRAFRTLPAAARRWGARGLAGLGLAAIAAALLSGAGLPSRAAAAAALQGVAAHATRAGQDQSGPTERGMIVGWPGGNAVIYQTVGFFGTPQILAVGSVWPDGSFAVHLPARVPVDLLGQSGSQCPTLRSSDPAALSNFTGDGLIYQHGVHIGDVHSGTTVGIASFTGFANGDTRSGFIYTDRDTTLTGFCERVITTPAGTVDFRQNIDLPLHRGWTPVVARFSVPGPGRAIADLTVGSNSANERWFFLAP